MAGGEPANGPQLPGAEALYDDAPCGLVLTDPDGTIRRVNATLCRWVGCQPEDLQGVRKIQDLLSMGGRIFHQTHWAPLLQIQGSVAEVKLELVHRDGRKIPMVLNAMRRRHVEGEFHEIALFIAEDRHKYEHELLLARKRAEQLLAQEQEAQRALAIANQERDRQRAVAEDRALFAEQMIGIVSHDLRNPLSVIRMSAHLLGMGELSSNQLAALGRVTASVSRANRLIVDLLDFTQARLGNGLQVSVKRLDLHAVVAECIADLRLAFPAGRLEHEAVGSGACVASSDRLVQMIGNLVANAMAYGAPHRPVTVTSRIEATTFSLAVHNEGPPIDPDLLPRLFEPMTRGEAAGKAAHSVGLGLFIVREIVRAHGGEVGVESASDVGTTFRATFPRQRMAED
jgi:sigma-B regulation protein RsbU (phosphoserine phosphatase)